MENPVKESMDDPSNSKPSARRRLVVRGAFAAPAALTLFSGSVAARSLTNCVGNQVQPAYAEKPGLTDSMGDTYVRVQLLRAHTPHAKQWSLWVPGEAVAALRATSPARTAFLAANEWMLYARDTESNYATRALGFKVSTKPTETRPGALGQHTGGQWVALRFDVDGNIVGVVGINDTAHPVTSGVWQSCWTSFRFS